MGKEFLNGRKPRPTETRPSPDLGESAQAVLYHCHCLVTLGIATCIISCQLDLPIKKTCQMAEEIKQIVSIPCLELRTGS